MSRSEVQAGMHWIEERFQAIAGELGADASLPDSQQEERWGSTGESWMKDIHLMAYYVGKERRVEEFRRNDLADAGAGDQSVQKKLDDHLRSLLKSPISPGKKIGF